MRIIASLEVGQAAEVLERPKREDILAEMRTVTQASGLEISEIMVGDSFYDRGCDVVETWYSEEEAATRKGSGVYCRKCGSRNYHQTWEEKIGYIYKCKDCGYDFGM